MNARSIALVLLVCAIAAASMPAVAEPPVIGRLFMTPDERASLDAQRAGGGRAARASAMPAAPPEAAEPSPAAEPPPPPAPVVVTGIVKRSDGHSTVWLNNVPQEDAAIKPEARTGAPSVTVPLQGGQRATVKAGQQLDVTTGEVRDAPTR